MQEPSFRGGSMAVIGHDWLLVAELRCSAIISGDQSELWAGKSPAKYPCAASEYSTRRFSQKFARLRYIHTAHNTGYCGVGRPDKTSSSSSLVKLSHQSYSHDRLTAPIVWRTSISRTKDATE